MLDCRNLIFQFPFGKSSFSDAVKPCNKHDNDFYFLVGFAFVRFWRIARETCQSVAKIKLKK